MAFQQACPVSAWSVSTKRTPGSSPWPGLSGGTRPLKCKAANQSGLPSDSPRTHTPGRLLGGVRAAAERKAGGSGGVCSFPECSRPPDAPKLGHGRWHEAEGNAETADQGGGRGRGCEARASGGRHPSWALLGARSRLLALRPPMGHPAVTMGAERWIKASISKGPSPLRRSLGITQGPRATWCQAMRLGTRPSRS